jgi:hypothetical protein
MKCPTYTLAALAAAFLLIPGALASPIESAPSINRDILEKPWKALWIVPEETQPLDYGVYHLRRHITLSPRPKRFVVHLAADDRYRLFVNGNPVCFGPQHNDTHFVRFDSVDLAPYLLDGDNVLAVCVWHFGPERPFNSMTVAAGFILQGDSPAEQAANTGPGWLAIRDASYSPVLTPQERLRTFIVSGPTEEIDGRTYPWGWKKPGFDDRAWQPPATHPIDPSTNTRGIPAKAGVDYQRLLRPRNIPFLLEEAQRLGSVRRSEGASPASGFLEGTAPVRVPANSEATLLLDQGFETDAFPSLVVSGGRNSVVTLAYAEALMDKALRKGNRNSIEGRKLVGNEDTFILDGGAHRTYSTLEFRCYRYLEIRVKTGSEPVTIDDISGHATGYPFAEKGSFTSDDPSLSAVWYVGWRTARMCAFDTYMDCPYYERLQYVGDTRIQALISLYVAGDDRLVRNALQLFDESRIPEGLTQSRYPTTVPQIIDTFSLLWIGMLHDYWMLRDDPGFVEARLPGVQSVLDWFGRHVNPKTGILGTTPYWSFVDWPDEWPYDSEAGIGGEPAGTHTTGSSIISLQYVMALDQAADLFRSSGRTDLADRYASEASKMRAAVRQLCWDPNRRLIADTAERKAFSQHANALAVLSGCITGAEAKELIGRVAHDPSLVQCTVYFRFYLLRAMKAAGLGDAYVDELAPWKTMIDEGLTTFAERPGETRSDCHAWSASPVYEFLATVCGVEPGSPGFKTVRIEPHLGHLRKARGVIPHPAGTIVVEVMRSDSRLEASVTLPAGLGGEFVWHGVTTPLPASPTNSVRSIVMPISGTGSP